METQVLILRNEGPLQGFGEGLVKYLGRLNLENDLGMARRCTEEFWAGHGALGDAVFSSMALSPAKPLWLGIILFNNMDRGSEV